MTNQQAEKLKAIIQYVEDKKNVDDAEAQKRAERYLLNKLWDQTNQLLLRRS